MNLNNFLNIPIIISIEKKTKIDRKYIFLSFLSLSYLIVYYFFGINIFTNFIGLIYPAYKSFITLHSKVKNDEVQWITYWIIFSFMNFFDMISNIVPLYYFIKICFTIWLFHENTKGAEFLYKFYFKPFLDNEFKNNSDNNLEINKFKKEYCNKGNVNITNLKNNNKKDFENMKNDCVNDNLKKKDCENINKNDIEDFKNHIENTMNKVNDDINNVEKIVDLPEWNLKKKN